MSGVSNMPWVTAVSPLRLLALVAPTPAPAEKDSLHAECMVLGKLMIMIRGKADCSGRELQLARGRWATRIAAKVNQ